MPLPPMPMPQGVPGGGLPPGMNAPPGQAGAATIPQGNPGNVKQALQLFDVAQKAMNQALPMIPMGSKAYGEFLKLVSSMNKLKTTIGEEVEASKQTMMQIMSQMKNQQQMKALGNVAPPPNAGPAMPPPEAAAPQPGM